MLQAHLFSKGENRHSSHGSKVFLKFRQAQLPALYQDSVLSPGSDSPRLLALLCEFCLPSELSFTIIVSRF